MKDGDLRTIFRVKFPTFQWTSVETAGTASGVPDSEFCTPSGVQGWIEFKSTKIYRVHLQPFQVSWIDKRVRYGGNVWIAIRRRPRSNREQGVDQLILMHGNQINALKEGGIENTNRTEWNGGPGNWNWVEIGYKLSGPLPLKITIV
jgi:hypothetical protein